MTTAPPPPTSFAEVQNLLSEHLPGYRRRPQQEALAAEIERTFQDGAHLLAEAGTGTGKSLGALIPAIMAVVKAEGSRCIVATSTIALQTQYAEHDLPFLERELGKAGVNFTWAPLKGISNFLCLAKLNERPNVENLDALLDEIAPDSEGNYDHTGDRNDVETPLGQYDWPLVSSTSAECPGKSKCAMSTKCFGMLHKAEAKDAQIVITNTAIVMTDVKINKQIRESSADGVGAHVLLDQYDQIIIDEAHELEEVATRFLGFEIKQGGLIKHLDKATNFLNLQGGAEVDAQGQQDKILTLLDALGQIIGKELGLFSKTLIIDNVFIEAHAPLLIRIYDELDRMATLVRKVKVERGSKEKQADTKERLTTEAENFLAELKEILQADPAKVVRWAELYGDKTSTVPGQTRLDAPARPKTRWVLKTAPIEVGPYLRKELWSEVSAVLMSATLSAGQGNDRFSYIARTLGLGGARGLDVGTPFDYKRQSLLYVPPANVPSPGPKTRAEWATWAPEAMMDLIKSTGGGALLLFTSTTSLKAAYENLAPRLAALGINSFRQGADATNKELALRFKTDENSVLFGLKSFMVGVDFPGRACRLVILDKLPFGVPTDPINKAREGAIKARGGNPFRDLSIPQMTLTLHQAFGRLIRTTTDYGTVAILDSRLSSSSWGRDIMRALPPASRTTSLDAVREFHVVREAAWIAAAQ
ncbi:ATP-dependent DNA helicase [Streptomyces sp. NPDC056454]|uniref:ATP-dependent DNA helicase n=1 Tax=Streptomyces sp. NPDC056454 TaxID=3345823 RepID=UPI003685F370